MPTDITTYILLITVAISSIVHKIKIKNLNESVSACNRSAYSETQKVRKELEEKIKHSNRLIQVLQNKINQLEKEIEALKQPKQEDDNT